MKSLIYILLSFLCLQVNSQSHTDIKETSNRKSDTICNYIVSRGDLNIVLPDSFDLKSNQRGFMILELKIDEIEKVTGWSINLFRIMENDSIVRNYSRYIDENVPDDIAGLSPLLDRFIKNISLRAINKDGINPLCKIGYRLKLIKN
jgi:hypothetical protein